jgi:hypothetical protein
MLLIGGALTLIALGIWLYCIFDVLTTDEADVRRLPKFVWFAIVLLGFFEVGAVLWLVFGRPRARRTASGTGSSPASALPMSDGDEAPAEPPKGPDDDPEFLRNLDRRLRGDESR